MAILMKVLLRSKIKFYYVLVIFSFFCFHTGVFAQDLESNIIHNVKEEIDQQFYTIDSSKEESFSKLQKKISYAVARQIDNQLFTTLQNHEKKEVYSDNPAYKLQDVSIPFIYKVPRWPIQSLFFLKKDLIGVFFNFSWATQAYGSSGNTQDVSDVVFQEGPFCVKDVLLASKLIDKGFATPTAKYKFLEILRNQPLCFDASVERQEASFSYIRHFLRGDIAIGLLVPVVRKKHKLKFTASLSDAYKSELESQNPDFFTLFPNGLIDFFRDMLARKNMSFGECDGCGSHDTEVGIGDIELFFNSEIIWRHCERCFFGLHLLVPTAKRRDVYKFWEPELGNGGFTQLSAFGSLLFSYGRWLNTHLLAQFAYAFPARVFRRVPRLRQTEDVMTNGVKYGEEFTPYGNYIYHSGTVPTFDERDATVRYFADTARKIRIRHGCEFFVRIGNMFERVFHERIFFDLFYDLLLKGRDYVRHRRLTCDYDPSVLTKNSYEVAHSLGCNLSCQFDNSWRLHCGGLYKFAGRNTLRTFDVEGGLTLEF